MRSDTRRWRPLAVALGPPPAPLPEGWFASGDAPPRVRLVRSTTTRGPSPPHRRRRSLVLSVRRLGHPGLVGLGRRSVPLGRTHNATGRSAGQHISSNPQGCPQGFSEIPKAAPVFQQESPQERPGSVVAMSRSFALDDESARLRRRSLHAARRGAVRARRDDRAPRRRGRMQISPDQGALLTLLTRSSPPGRPSRSARSPATRRSASLGPRRRGKLLCCDVSEEFTAIARGPGSAPG